MWFCFLTDLAKPALTGLKLGQMHEVRFQLQSHGVPPHRKAQAVDLLVWVCGVPGLVKGGVSHLSVAPGALLQRQ